MLPSGHTVVPEALLGPDWKGACHPISWSQSQEATSMGLFSRGNNKKVHTIEGPKSLKSVKKTLTDSSCENGEPAAGHLICISAPWQEVKLGGGALCLVKRIMIQNKSGILEDIYFCYTSVENSCPKEIYSFAARVLIYIALCLLIALTVSGNLMVIIIISHFKQLHTPTNYLILSLAGADFLLGGFVMPPSMIRSVETCWYFGQFFCKFHTSTDMMLSLSSVLHLAFISVDRYYAVCFPLTYNAEITVVLVIKVILIIWCFSALFGFIMVFQILTVKKIDFYYDQSLFCVGSCVVLHTKTTTLISCFVGFIIPALVILGIYLKIFMVARNQVRAIKEVTEKNELSRKRERKSAKTLATVIGVYIICWMPFFLCNTVYPFINNVIPALLIDILIWFAYLNSTCNPFIYAFFYKWFRKAIRIILLGKIFYGHSSLTRLYTE
ncbi:trace amine-associated receptor 1-like [Erpetoichthys calabaricus]|uniref:trace amine-associated receptor 1-like n=1 Tax=Erpetoichthys calabaricus TaxID=27687 RepID=UPI0010A05613|nr:trace amine-associated receptor 1-like [Erpetoichthys calabaricus]